jgi:hypothetical protein
MHVKGTALLARKALLLQEFGDQRGAEIFAELAQRIPYFQEPILASTSIPIEQFFRFQDELLRRHYKNDPLQYFHYGEASAEWALVKGPYKRLLQDKSVARFAEHGVVLFKTYFDEGAAETSLGPGYIDYRIVGVSPSHRHPYLEYATIGYFKRGLELLGATGVVHKRLEGFTTGAAQVHYQIAYIDPAEGR